MPKTEAHKAKDRRSHKKWLAKHPEKELANIKRWVKRCPDDIKAKECLLKHETKLLAAIKNKQA